MVCLCSQKVGLSVQEFSSCCIPDISTRKKPVQSTDPTVERVCIYDKMISDKVRGKDWVLSLWLCPDATRELCGCTVLCFLTFPVPVITEDVFDAFDASPFLTFSPTASQTAVYPVLQRVHFGMVVLQEHRERLHGDRAAEHKLIKAAMQLCVQIAQPQAPGRGTNYIFSLSPCPLQLSWCPQSVSMCGQAQESKWHLFVSLSPSISSFLHLNLLLGIFLTPSVFRHSASRLLTEVQKVISVLPPVPLCLTFSTFSFYTCSLEVCLWLFFPPPLTFSITLSPDSLGARRAACRTWHNM